MLKRLAQSIRKYKWAALLSPLFIAGEVVLEVLIPRLMANLIDNGVYLGQMNVAYKVGFELILAAMLSLLCGVLSGIFAAKASSGFAKNLRKDLYYKVQEFSFANIDKFSTASLVTRLTTDVSNVQQAFQMIIRITVRAPLMLVFSLIMALSINVKLSSVLLFVLPVVAFTLFFGMSRVHPLMTSVFKKYDNLNSVVEENVHGIRVVKSFVTEEKEKNKFNTVSTDIYNTFTKAEKIMAFTSPIMQFATYVCILGISWFGANIIVKSNMTELTTGQLSTFFTYIMQILSSLMMIAMIVIMMIMAIASGKRISEVLDEEPSIKNPENPVKDVKNGDIEFKNVSFSYVGDKNKECLKNINIKIKSGETIGIIGGTGSGKSSLVNLIPRLYDATEGEVLVGDVNVKDYDIKSLRDNVANVLQKNVLFSGTIKDNIRWGNEDATDDEIIRVCKLAQADEFIKSFEDGYDTYIEQGGTNVSGGQKQRLCIARALMKKPKILILDDSTSAVDTKTDSLIRKAFKEEIPDTTKIIIAQRIASVEDADKIIVIDNGKIDGFGTHEELIKTNEIYKEVYESQVKGSDIDA